MRAAALARAQAQSLASAAGARQSWEELLKGVRSCGDAAQEAEVLAAWTNASMQHGDSAAALESETARYTLAVRAQLRTTRADAAARLGTLYTDRGEIDLADRRLQEAAALFEELKAYSESADVRSRMSRLHRRAGDYLAALQDEQTALRLRRQITPASNVWRSLLNVAVLYEQLELPDEARRRTARR
jgi:tetratricopeptide (TPR) repeat protein